MSDPRCLTPDEREAMVDSYDHHDIDRLLASHAVADEMLARVQRELWDAVTELQDDTPRVAAQLASLASDIDDATGGGK